MGDGDSDVYVLHWQALRLPVPLLASGTNTRDVKLPLLNKRLAIDTVLIIISKL